MLLQQLSRSLLQWETSTVAGTGFERSASWDEGRQQEEMKVENAFLEMKVTHQCLDSDTAD